MPLTQPGILWPVRFATSNPTIRVVVNANPAEDLTLSVTSGTDYWLSGDGDTDSGEADLLPILKTCLETYTADGGATYTMGLTARHHITITAGSPNGLTIYWSHANTTVDETIFGGSGTEVASGAVLTTTNQTKGVWLPNVSGQYRGYRMDTKDMVILAGAYTPAISGLARGYHMSSVYGEREIGFHLLSESQILTSQTTADEPYGNLESAYTNALALGRSFRLYDDITNRTTSSYTTYRLKEMTRPFSKTQVGGKYLYEATLKMRRA